MNPKIMKTMDGNEAAAYISYAFTEVATIYPITPSSPMAEHVDTWAANGKKNLFGQTVRLVEMESEAGAAGAMHGALEAGTLTTTYTASQGLLLMIPPMYRIAGQLKPGVFHVSSRTVGTHAFSIFGDHSDVMSCRQIGCAMLSAASVQEVMDLGGVAHLAAIKGSVPFIHFFDGFRTSHELQKIEVMDYKDIGSLMDEDALHKFRKNALNPERPVQRSTVQNPDVFFQNREACSPFYKRLPGIVEEYMNEINKLTGRSYKLFNYFGATDATHVIIAMGSVSGAIQEVVEHLTQKGEKVGFLQVHLYRPFSMEHFMAALPESTKIITVMDRTKEPGALGEPLYEDVCSALMEEGRVLRVLAGRYGLSSKDVTPAQIVAVFDNMKTEQKNHFTVGINDDVSMSSLRVGAEPEVADESTIACKFWGLGSDGTVGANKNSIKIIGDHTDKYAQAYFEYDTKKSGGITKSHLRFGDRPIRSSYLISKADFVACHQHSYINKYDIVSEIKPGGTFLLNCAWKAEELDGHLPGAVKRYIANHNISFYTIDAVEICREIGLGNRTNTVLQSAFFKLANIIPAEDALGYMKAAIEKSYGKKGEKIVNMNYAAVDAGLSGLVKIDVPESWKNAKDMDKEDFKRILPEYVEKLLIPMNAQKGDTLPVSVFLGREDGTVPLGTSAYEKRGVAIDVPQWNIENCIQCNQCSYVCPHACIRPFLLSEEEAKNAPVGYETKKANGGGEIASYRYRIQVDPLDCQGCGACVEVCPAKEKALTMKPLDSQLGEMANWEYSLSLSHKENPLDKYTVKGSQFEQPLLEFSGACAGCGETPYAKLMTQLYGDRMYLANATGCTQAWGAAAPCVPYTTNKDGWGPAWSNSLFENNAEFSMGMVLAVEQQRERVKMQLNDLLPLCDDEALLAAAKTWLDHYDDGHRSKEDTRALLTALENAKVPSEGSEFKAFILDNKEHLTKKSMWMYGGDGWAYDIGYGGLDHVLASGTDVNVLIVDTEVYSNTGGQSSKATPIGAVAQFAAGGKPTVKKDLGMLAMSYGYIYVAQVAMGANPAQLVKAMKEAEAYKGPSLIIAYAPCINHGIMKGMANAQLESKLAVDAGYWFLYRYNPELKKQGKNPFILDSKEPTMDYNDFIMGEVRYSSLVRTFPETAKVLLKEAAEQAAEKYKTYKKLAEQY
ncbi:pyruvate-flavodoxin oxidoreductase [Anaerotignum neopropionicum]|uniref:Pyruvate:ferredoxin oxidoreductase n=1 Tax=Anaerotignum neopropionicum TaxID=36847 RepID=A0A136WID6_9FIRM|nr:pyruvate:ferredoxin (flavodoxin) oxidoreductase [Anaerotignum neopropionicum]KXL54203.1 pyruvate-flavodoxin oxidoreductase [Anaerotignum neopropionicum]KXL54328.1 pyruvate-flavodoxin oxidoreductase [Anaerotignum neopropionicum]